MKSIQEIAQKTFDNKSIGWIVFSFFIMYCTTQGHFVTAVIKYGTMNSYVDYHFGFVKRGLFSEIINLLPFSHTITLRLMTYCISFTLIIFFITQYKHFFTKKEYILPLCSILFAPFFIKNYMLAVGLSDILFFLIFLGVMMLYHRIALILFILYPMMVFIHEAMSLFFLPWIIFIFYCRFKDDKITLYSANILMIIGFFIASSCILLYGHTDISLQELKKYVGSKDNSFDSDDLEFFSFFYLNYLEHIKFTWNSLFYKGDKLSFSFVLIYNFLNLLNWYLVYFLARPVCMACVHTIKTFLFDNKINLSLCLGLIFISTVPLFIMATDWFRFVANFIGLMILTSIFCNKDTLINTYMRHINHFSNQKYVMFMLMTFMFAGIGICEHIFRIFLSSSH